MGLPHHENGSALVHGKTHTYDSHWMQRMDEREIKQLHFDEMEVVW